MENKDERTYLIAESLTTWPRYRRKGEMFKVFEFGDSYYYLYDGCSYMDRYKEHGATCVSKKEFRIITKETNEIINDYTIF